MTRKLNIRGQVNRLEAYCHGPSYKHSKDNLMGHDKAGEECAKTAKVALDTLLARHLDYCKIEEFIADNPVLLQYYSIAEEECSRNKKYGMASVMINALEKIAEVLLEHEKSYEHMPQPELVKRIKELETENEEFRSTINKLEDIYDVIEKCRNNSDTKESK